MKVYLTDTVLYDGRERRAGDELEVSDEVGADLIERELAAKTKKAAEKQADSDDS